MGKLCTGLLNHRFKIRSEGDSLNLTPFTPNYSFTGVTGQALRTVFLPPAALARYQNLLKGLLTNLGKNNHSLLIYFLQSPASTISEFHADLNLLFKITELPWAE